jgi:hypothetical protein
LEGSCEDGGGVIDDDGGGVARVFEVSGEEFVSIFEELFAEVIVGILWLCDLARGR